MDKDFALIGERFKINGNVYVLVAVNGKEKDIFLSLNDVILGNRWSDSVLWNQKTAPNLGVTKEQFVTLLGSKKFEVDKIWETKHKYSSFKLTSEVEKKEENELVIDESLMFDNLHNEICKPFVRGQGIFANRVYYLPYFFDWKIGLDDKGSMCLIPLKKVT